MKATKHSFGVSVDVDKTTGDVIAVYFKVRNGKSAETAEFEDGSVFVDYNANGELLGMEMLAPCSIRVLDRVTHSDPETQRFIRRSVPREMALA